MDSMMIRQALKFSIALAATMFLLGDLCSEVAGQTPPRNEVKTITLGLVSETNQQDIAEHFRDLRILRFWIRFAKEICR